jgi:hypothetical protein
MGSKVDESLKILYKIRGFFRARKVVCMGAALPKSQEYELSEEFLGELGEPWDDEDWDEVINLVMEEVCRALGSRFDRFDEEYGKNTTLAFIRRSSNQEEFLGLVRPWMERLSDDPSAQGGRDAEEEIGAEEDAEDAEAELDSRPVDDDDDEGDSSDDWDDS